MDYQQYNRMESDRMDTPVQQPQRPMKWHKFLIYFSLWAGALMCLINALQVFMGMPYGGMEYRDYAYMYLPSLRLIDIVCALLYLAIGVYYIVVRFQLARLRVGAPGKLLAVMVMPTILNVIYSIVVVTMLEGAIDIPQLIGTVIGAVVGVLINKVYYDKRSYMFVN